jgi:hypothetical protein
MLLCLTCRGLAYRRPVEGRCPECRQPWEPTKTLVPRAPVPPPPPETPLTAPELPPSPPVSVETTRVRVPGRARGGAARAAKLTPERRAEISSKAAKTRWEKPRPAPLPPKARDLDFRVRHFGPPIPPVPFTLDRQLLGYTYWAAFVAHQRHHTGNILREMERGQMLDTKIDRDTCEVMLLLLFITPNTLILAKATGIEEAFIYEVGARMCQHGIADLKTGIFQIDWFEEEAGSMALLLDLMCVRGHLTRSIKDDRPAYEAKKNKK